MAPRNRTLDPRGLESPGPIFKTPILSLVSSKVSEPLSIPACCSGRSTAEHRVLEDPLSPVFSVFEERKNIPVNCL